MKKLMIICGSLCFAYNANAYDYNPEDPLFLGSKNEVTSKTSADFFDSNLNINQYLAWAVTDKTSIYADISYRNDMDESNDGFSGPRFGFETRLSDDGFLIYDFLGNIKLSGSSKVPEFKNTQYSFGLKGGISKNVFTVAGTLTSSWVFDGNDGYAWIDFIPEGQIRFVDDWSSNISFQFRKSTTGGDDNIIGDDILGKLSVNKVYGRTQYVGYVGYSFKEYKDFIGGFRLNIVF